MWDLDREVPTLPHPSEAYPNSKLKESPGLINHHLFVAKPQSQTCRLAPALVLAVPGALCPIPAAPQGGLAMGSGAAARRQEDLPGSMTSSSPRPGHQVLGGRVRETVPPTPLCLTEAHASYSRDANTQGNVSRKQLRLSLMRCGCPSSEMSAHSVSSSLPATVLSGLHSFTPGLWSSLPQPRTLQMVWSDLLNHDLKVGHPLQYSQTLMAPRSGCVPPSSLCSCFSFTASALAELNVGSRWAWHGLPLRSHSWVFSPSLSLSLEDSPAHTALLILQVPD